MIKKRPKKTSAPSPLPVKPAAFVPVPFGAPSSSLRPLEHGQYWLRQPGDNTQFRALGATNLEVETVDMGGFKFDDSDAARWELAPVEIPMLSCQRLLRDFYHEARWWRKPKAWARDPEKEGIPIFGNTSIIIALYGRNYHITIERNELFGPHACRLFYRSYGAPSEIAWIAIVQIEGMWHSDDRLLAALNHEIKNRNLYQSTFTAKLFVLE